MADRFFAAAEIKDRLAARCTLVERIHVVAAIGAALELLQATPALFIIPWDEVVANDDPIGISAFTEQRWLILVVARQTTDIEHGATVVAEAGAIVSEVIGALSGWGPPQTPQLRLQRLTAPRIGANGAMIDYEKGVAAIPLLFALPIFSKGDVDAED